MAMIADKKRCRDMAMRILNKVRFGIEPAGLVKELKASYEDLACGDTMIQNNFLLLDYCIISAIIDLEAEICDQIPEENILLKKELGRCVGEES